MHNLMILGTQIVQESGISSHGEKSGATPFFRSSYSTPKGNFLVPKFFRFKIIVPFHKIGLIGWARQALKNGQKKAKFAASKI